MKQGRASHSGMASTKVEPKPHAINEKAVARIGVKQGDHATGDGSINFKHEPLYQGRGLKAPMKGQTQHPKGSQGQY